MEAARQDHEVRFLAILDADLDRVEGSLQDLKDVVWTDGHDIETMLVFSPALEKVLHQYIDKERIERKELEWGENIRARLHRHALFMGGLRWANLKYNFGLVFSKAPRKKGVSFSRFAKYSRCIEQDWAPSYTKSTQAILDYSNKHSCDLDDLVNRSLSLVTGQDAFQVCNGHDLVGFLTEGIQALSGPRRTLEEWTELLVAAADIGWLQDTLVWKELLEWEQSHEITILELSMCSSRQPTGHNGPIVDELPNQPRICASPEFSARLEKSSLGDVAALLRWPPEDFEAGLRMALESRGYGLIEGALPGCRAWLRQREGRSLEIEAVLSLSDLSFELQDPSGPLSDLSVSVAFSAWTELEVSAAGRFRHMAGCQIFGLANMVIGKHYMIEQLEIDHLEVVVPSPSFELE